MRNVSKIVAAGLVALASTTALSVGVFAQENPTVGGAEMLQSRNIIENAVNSPDHTTLVAAVQAAGLVETLQGEGPFTVLAPTNDAFAALPAGTVEDLLKPENQDMLVQVLTCHVIPTRALSTDISGMVADDGGVHQVTTVGGCVLQLRTEGNTVTITDETGGVAQVTIADVIQSNGVIHVIDKVLLPGAAAAAGDGMGADEGSNMSADGTANDDGASDSDDDAMAGEDQNNTSVSGNDQEGDSEDNSENDAADDTEAQDGDGEGGEGDKGDAQ